MRRLVWAAQRLNEKLPKVIDTENYGVDNKWKKYSYWEQKKESLKDTTNWSPTIILNRGTDEKLVLM